MDKLEEQLRASRRREVPDLTPPAGGWEAISAQLASGAGAAGVAASAVEQAAAGGVGATTATAAGKAGLLLWLKSLVGLGSVLLLLGGALTYYVMADGGTGASLTTDTGQAMTVALTDPTRAKEPTSKVAIASGDEDGAVAVREIAAVPESPAQAVTTPPAPVRRQATPPAGTALTSERNEVAPSAKAVIATKAASPTKPVTPTAPAGTLPPNAVETSTKSALPFAANSTAPATPPEKKTPGEANTIIDPVAIAAPAGGAPVPDRETVAATASLQPGLYFIADNDPTKGLSLPAIDAVPIRLDRKGHPSAPAFWQVHGTTSFYTYESWNPLKYFTEDDAGDFQFILPGGEIRSFAPTVLNNSSSRFNSDSWSLRAGISRQASSGFLFRSSLMIYQQQSRVDENVSRQPALNEIRVSSDQREFAVIGELGLQYTFLKRHRFRPWVGVGLMSFLYSRRSSTDIILEGSSGMSAIDGQASFIQNYPLSLQLTFSTGIQYQINNRWSAGAMLWMGNADYIFVEAPINLEVRYSLFK